jgi:seryl-tRNA synthetase
MSKMIYKTAICLGLILVMQQNCFAQKTKDELKAEREVLKSEMKSKDAEERKAKFEKLSEPKISGISSVDALTASSTKLLLSTKEMNLVIPEMYKRTVGESVDGIADVTVKRPSLDELATLGLNIANQIKTIGEASASVAGIAGDIKSAGIMQAPKGIKSLNFSKDVISLILPELGLNLKVITNLIATLKSSNNY